MFSQKVGLLLGLALPLPTCGAQATEHSDNKKTENDSKNKKNPQLFSEKEQLDIVIEKNAVVVKGQNSFGKAKDVTIKIPPVNIQKTQQKTKAIVLRQAPKNAKKENDAEDETRSDHPKISPLWTPEAMKTEEEKAAENKGTASGAVSEKSPTEGTGSGEGNDGAAKGDASNTGKGGTPSSDDNSILGKYLKKQEHANTDGVVVPTGSALFELRNVPCDDGESTNEDIADVRLMQKLVKEKKLRKEAEEKKRREDAAKQTVAPLKNAKLNAANKETVVAKQVSVVDIKNQENNHSNKFLRIGAHNLEQVEKKDAAAKLADATKLTTDNAAGTKLATEKEPVAQLASDKEPVDKEPAALDQPALESPSSQAKVLNLETTPDKKQFQLVECDVSDIETNNVFNEGETKFYESNKYQEIPASVVTTTESPQLKLSGSFCSHVGAVVQEDARDDKDGDLHVGTGWADLSWEVTGLAFDNFSYKYAATLQVVSGDISMMDHYVELAHQYGSLQMGNLKGPEAKYTDDATWLVGGTGGVDGSLWGLLCKVSGLPHTHHLIGYSKRATKIVYNSPRLAGFQFGVGYCPNPKHEGWGDLNEANYGNSNDNGVQPTGDMKKRHNFALGVNFTQSVKDCEVTAALVGVSEQCTLMVEVPDTFASENIYESDVISSISRELNLKRSMSYHATWSMKYKNLKIAAGIINNGEQTMLPTKFSSDRLGRFGSELGDAGRVWNVGGKYTVGCIDIGYARHSLRRRVTNYDYSRGVIHAISVDCNVASGVQIFAEVDHIDLSTAKGVAVYDENAKPLKNRGTAVLVGSKLSF
ncbi:MAG: porin [Holosporales bacterium]|nr:porin [Holosporales bacterium]